MCCLPNRFPLPVYLLINKFDSESKENLTWLDETKIENYVKENQFIEKFQISSVNNEMREFNCLNNKTSELTNPLKELIRNILQFKDIKEKLNQITNKSDSIKKSAENKNKNSKNKSDDKNKKCFIL